jgi:hypothetical protein
VPIDQARAAATVPRFDSAQICRALQPPCPSAILAAGVYLSPFSLCQRIESWKLAAMDNK